MACTACVARGKTWQGDDPRCAFEGGAFSREGWMCATVGLIRDMVYEGQALPGWIDYQYCDDQKYATVRISELELEGQPLALWVSWYKGRGGTDAMWLLFDDAPPRPPTEAECIAIARVQGGAA